MLLACEDLSRISLYELSCKCSCGSNKSIPVKKKCSDAAIADGNRHVAEKKSSSGRGALRILDGFPTLVEDSCKSRWEHAVRVEDEAVFGHVNSVRRAAVMCLLEGNPRRKASLTLAAASLYRQGKLSWLDSEDVVVPEEPARCVKTVAAADVPRRGKGGSLKNRISLVHSLAHIESVAIDLSWDMVARFGDQRFPKEFYDDWVVVAEDEARHFLMWEKRLEDMGSWYGELPTHSGLWDSAKKTSGCVLERLVVEHMILEARGLDVAPKTFAKFIGAGDKESALMLEAIYSEEISHVGKGVRWFLEALRREDPLASPEKRFKEIAASKFLGKLKPPFNDQARAAAGMPKYFYNAA